MNDNTRKLPGSGSIALSQIKTEFKKGNSLTAYYGVVSGIPSSGRIKITDFYGKEAGGGVDPDPGLNPALIPAFGAPVSEKGGYAVQITNYNAAYTWATSPSAGTASIRSNGLMYVQNLADGQSSTVTVTTTRTGYNTGSAAVTGKAENGAIEPTDTPIQSVITGGSFTTNGGNKIGTITSTVAEGCMTINAPATGSYSNNITTLWVGGGAGGAGGGRQHQSESNGSFSGGGGGGGGAVYLARNAAAGQTYCGKCGIAGPGGYSKNRGGNGQPTTIRATGISSTKANGGGGGGSHGGNGAEPGQAGGNGGGGGGRYGTGINATGGTGWEGNKGGTGNTGGGGGGGGMGANGVNARAGGNDTQRFGGAGGAGATYNPFGVYGAGGGGASAGSNAGGAGGNGGGGNGGRSVGGNGTATAGSKQGAGGGGGGAYSNGTAAEVGKAGSPGIIKFAHAI